MKLRAALGAGLLLLASAAWADFARVGPADSPSPPGNGFPLWYQDLNGLVLDLCLPDGADAQQADACLMETPPPYTFPTNFPGEAFYFRATSTLDVTPQLRAVLVLALEAAFANENPAPGDQMVFARIRITAGVPVAGTYVVTHPWGVDTFTAVEPTGDNRAIVFTEDVGLTAGVFTDALKGRAGPFLTQPNGTVAQINGGTFLSDSLAPVPVTGSRFGTNYFEICGPFDGPGTDRCIRQDLFTLTGRVHTAPIASPLKIERATYTRATTGATQIDVAATATAGINQPAPKLTAAAPVMGSYLMTGPNALGLFYAQALVGAEGEFVPGLVSVINSGDNPPSLASTALVDEVAVEAAVYDPTAKTLTVTARSSDKLPPPAGPVLVLDGFPAAVATGADPVTFVVSALEIPPTAVDVVSTAGGVGRADVTVNAGPAFPPGVPLALNDFANATAGGPAITIAVLANDVAAPVAPALGDVQAGNVQPAGAGTATLQPDGTVVFTPTSLAGIATFQYTVKNAVGTSNPATVSVTVAGGANPVPLAANDTVNVVSGLAVVINVLANDSGNGGTLDPASVTVSTPPPSGTTAVNTQTGAITYTSPAGAPAAPVTFQYTVANTNGQVSTPATVTVNVLAPEAITATRVRCRNSDWDVRGVVTSSSSTSVTLYRQALLPADPTVNVLGTAAVDGTGAFSFRTRGPACVNAISARTNSGAIRENIPVTQ